MYKKEFEIRWSDVDANMHLANSAYTNYMSHTRMAFFFEHGFTMEFLKEHNLGPVVFYEHMHYFKECFLGMPIFVTLEISGLTEDGKFFMFEHNFYDKNGKNLATCEILGSWIDLTVRNLVSPPKLAFQKIDRLEKAPHFKILTKEDTRKYNKRPIDISKKKLVKN